jgi:predicted dehydrogenase
MKQVRIGIIGIGNMGSLHAKSIFEGKVPGGVLTAVCDINPERLEWAKSCFVNNVETFDDAQKMFASGIIDAVIIATPHYLHPTLAIQAFQYSLHVLVEKPAGVYTKQVREMNEVAEKTDKVFCMMFNQRINPVYQKVKDLVQSGELGELRRVNWIITEWFRTQAYYDSGSWRATWGGEGGGVIVNQCPHQLDLLQWIYGLPKRVMSFCQYGKHHNIEVEDEVTAYFEYENGSTGVFITSTGECPGTNRLEITGDRGKIVVENNKISFYRTRDSVKNILQTSPQIFAAPEVWHCDVPVHGQNTSHIGIMTNWVQAILNATPLIAPGTEGIRGVELANAIHLSSWIKDWVEIPVNEELFLQKLNEKINSSSYKKVVQNKVSDVTGTFGS